jgi:hypothetical protein
LLFLSHRTEAEKVRSEAVENAGTLATALDVEEKAHAELRSAVADFSLRFGGENLVCGASERSRLSALGGHIRAELRGAFRNGMKSCMAVICSHFSLSVETLKTLSGGFFFDAEDEGQEDAKRAELYALVEEPANELAGHFEDEVCPPYSPISSSYEPCPRPTDVSSEDTPLSASAPGVRVGDATDGLAASRTGSVDPGVEGSGVPPLDAAGPGA